MSEDLIVESILKERYYQPGESSWEDICERVCAYVTNEKASNEHGFFLEMMLNKRFIPNSPCLMNAGTNNPQMSACFTLPVDDSIPEIFDAIKCAAIIHKSGGGTGFNFSDLRGKGSIVNGTGHCASGPVSFMRVFNEATETIKQGGKRRGANLGSLDVDHPDIEEFITCKSKEGDLSNFNISININNIFMNKVLKHDPTVKKIWDMMVDGNWNNGEPGFIFSDRAELDNTCPHLGKLRFRNPCQEFIGLEWESCNLGSLNCTKYIDECGVFNWEMFENDIRHAVWFLNNVIDKNKFPLSQIEIATKKTRKIGLGIMGFADALIMMNIRYGNDKSVEFAKELIKFMRRVADSESYKLTDKYGPYPEAKEDKRRNASVLSIAPTGTISLIAGCSSSIEPNFAYVNTRSTWVSGEKKAYKMLHPLFKQHVNNRYPANVSAQIVDWMHNNGTIQNCPFVDIDTKEIFVTAIDVTPKQHILMQSTIQNNGVDQAISKTINCPNNTTKEDISNMIIEAWQSGCKGLTVYREGSRNDVVLETNKVVKSANPVEALIANGNGRILPKTPRSMMSVTEKRNSACGKLYITIGEVDNKPHTVLIKNKGGGCTAMIQTVAELTAAMLRWQIPRWEIVRILNGIRCEACLKNPKADGRSCSDIIGKVLRENYPDEDIPNKYEDEIPNTPDNKQINKVACPKCGKALIFAEGCRSCPECGYSKCS